MSTTVETGADLLAQGAEAHGINIIEDYQEVGEMDALNLKEIQIAEQIISDFYPLKNKRLHEVFPKMCACCKFSRHNKDKYQKIGAYLDIDTAEMKKREEELAQYVDDNLNKIIESQKNYEQKQDKLEYRGTDLIEDTMKQIKKKMTLRASNLNFLLDRQSTLKNPNSESNG